MAEVRMLPKHTPRSTGIERVTQSAARPNNAVGNNATSHVSASPGASARAHAHVVSARDPAGVNRPQPQRAQQIQTQGSRSTAAKVELLPNLIGKRGGVGPAPTGASGQRTVQVIAAPRLSAGTDGPEFTAEQMLLVASLLEGYAERTKAIADLDGEATARSALLVLRDMHAARSGRLSRPGHPAATSIPADASPSVDDDERGPIVVAAETSTTVVSSTAAAPGDGPRAA